MMFGLDTRIFAVAKSELISWENIMQNIKLVGANFDIGHQYSRPASHTFFQYYIMQPISLLILRVIHY